MTGNLIRAARLGDLDALQALEQRFPGDRLSRRALRHHVENPAATLLVAEAADGISGYALLLRRADSSWWRLYSIVRAPWAPRGTADDLLTAALDLARRAGAEAVRLEVREDNAAAIRLYERHGFVLCGTRDHYYEDGARALRMTLVFDG